MLKDLFFKPRFATVNPGGNEITESQENQAARPDIKTDGLWLKCEECQEILYIKELQKNLKVCFKCGYHLRMTAWERIETTLDEGSFVEWDNNLSSTDPLQFPGYQEKLDDARQKTGLDEAIVTGQGTINGLPVVVGVMDARFIMASMGVVVGEKIVRAAEGAVEKDLPLILFAASGGARMQEGVLSLMQMARTSAALTRLAESKNLYISILTDPTTGGVSASFAMLGDIILAEPQALVGFTGPRVIQQTIRQTLPEGFQRPEFLREHGMIDDIVERPKLKERLGLLLSLHEKGGV